MFKNHTSKLKGSSFIGCVVDHTQVATIQKYLEKLHPSCSRLFQRALLSPGWSASTWFMNSPLSQNLLSTMMTDCGDCQMLLVYRYPTLVIAFAQHLVLL